MPKITSSEKLWNEFSEIKFRIENLGSIVQNDIVIPQTDIEWWETSVKKSIKDLWEWYKKVKKHIDE